MAGAEKLIEKIIGDARAEAERLRREAEDKKLRMREELDRNIAVQKAQIEKDAAAAAAENSRRLNAVYDLEYRKALLGAKQEMMGKARALVLEKLKALSEADYLKLMKERLLACAVSGEGSVIVSRNEQRINDAFLAYVNKELMKTAGKGELKFADEKRDMAGGFVYITSGMEINMSLEALLNEAWTDSETEVARLLFE